MNRCVMLALVSDQPMPNIMAVLQYDPPPNHVEFIVSADKTDASQYDPWYDDKYYALCRAIQPLGISCNRMPPAHPYRLRDVKAQCLDAIARHPDADHFVINVTGGTKLMALAAYLAGLESRHPIVYVESRDRRLIAVSGSISTEQPFDEVRFRRINVKRYLTAYGRTIEQETSHKALSGQDVATAHFFVNNLSAARPLLRKITEAVYAGGDPRAPRHFALESLSTSQQGVLDRLIVAGYLTRTGQPQQFAVVSEAGWHFLKGTWLEVYAFDTLYCSCFFDGVRCNVHLKGAPGELDVVLARNASLGICEAKFGAKLSIIMSRLRALKETLAGVYGRIFYVTARAKVTKDMENLARVYGVTRVITGPELPHIAELIRERM
jgi:hypothetical protein